MTTQQERWNQMLEEFAENNKTLEECVKSFLAILDIEEESDSGRVFKPTYINTARAQHSAKLEVLFKRMKELVKK